MLGMGMAICLHMFDLGARIRGPGQGRYRMEQRERAAKAAFFYLPGHVLKKYLSIGGVCDRCHRSRRCRQTLSNK